MKKILLLTILLSMSSHAADFSVQFSPEDNSITTAKIQDGAVTDAKVSSISSSKISDLNSKLLEMVPVGTVFDFAGDNCPAGYLKNDGSSLSRSAYSELFNAIGTAYGSVDASSFNLPKHDWMIDANIGGGVISISTTTSNYTEMTQSNLNLVLNTSKGSESAQIPCSSTNTSSGLTCAAGNESLGISFIPMVASTSYEVCASFAPAMDNSVTGNVATSATFQLIETPNNAQTILQEGGERTESYVYKQNLGTGGLTTSSPIKICGTFKFSDINRKTIRLMYESAALNGNFIIYADRLATQGQRDVKFTVRPLNKIGKCIKH